MKRKKLITSIILIAGANILVAGCWYLVFLSVKKERNVIIQTQEEISANGQRLNNAHFLNTLLKNIEEDEEKIGTIFLNSRDIVKFIEELEFFSQKASTTLAVSDVTVPSQNTEKPIFGLQISGSFRNVFQYLLLLENIPYQISLDEVKFTEIQAGGKDNVPTWEVDFKVRLLSYVQ